MSEGESMNRRRVMTPSGAMLPQAFYVALPVLESVDVLVVGGGPAGIGAALAANRQGARCLLVEGFSFFGGSAVWGLGKPMEDMRPGGKPRSKIHEEVMKHLDNQGDRAVRVEGEQFYPNVHFLKAALVDALDAAECPYYVHVQAVDAVVSGNRVTGVVLATKQGMMRVDAKVVIDCTGEASMAAFSGAQTFAEVPAEHAVSLSAAYVDMDLSAVKAGDVAKAFDAARGKHTLLPKKNKGLTRVSNAQFGFMDHGGFEGIDPLDPRQRSKAECDSRRQVVQMEQAMIASTSEALKDIDICEGAPRVNVALPRRVKGAYTLTGQNVDNGVDFDDAIALRFEGSRCGVPFRAMVPAGLDGLIVAGRGISADRAAVSTTAGNCMATGHAAGLASALAVKGGVTPRKIEVKKLQGLLEADGVCLKISR